MRLIFKIILIILPIGIFAQSGDSYRNAFIVTFGGCTSGPIQNEKAIGVDSLELFINANVKGTNPKIVGFTFSPILAGFDISLKSYSNKLTKEQKDRIKKLPVFTVFYLEDIYISVNEKVINFGGIRFEISGYSCSVQRRPQKSPDGEDVLLNRESAITISELISNNVLLVQKPGGRSFYCDIDTNIKISEFSCEIVKYSTEIDANGTEYWVSDVTSDSTYVVNGNKIPNDLKNKFSELCDRDWIRFQDIKATNRDGVKQEVAPLYLEIIK